MQGGVIALVDRREGFPDILGRVDAGGWLRNIRIQSKEASHPVGSLLLIVEIVQLLGLATGDAGRLPQGDEADDDRGDYPQQAEKYPSQADHQFQAGWKDRRRCKLCSGDSENR
jgi:hypothetical protein